MHAIRAMTSALSSVAVLAGTFIPPGPARAAEEVAAADRADSPAAIARIIQTFAKTAVDTGAAVGIAVGVTFRGRPAQFFSYGIADAGAATPVTPDTIFEMGSVTKVFTTALLADAAVAG